MAVRRIKYAYYDPAWDKTTMSLAALTRTEVGPLEYTSEMRGHLHCPSCYESLIRVPIDPSISVMAHEREALFRHLPDTDHTAPQCLLRSGIMVGKNIILKQKHFKPLKMKILSLLVGSCRNERIIMPEIL